MTTYTYDSISELLTATNQPYKNDKNKAFTAGNMGGGEGWICGDRKSISTVAEATAELAKGTFDAGVERLETLAAKMDLPTPVSVRRRNQRGPEGDELCMDRMRQGDVDTMWTRCVRQTTVSPARVRIGVMISGSCILDSKKMAWRGVAALALSRVLDEAGYTSEVVACSRSKLRLAGGALGDDEFVDVVIKSAGAPLDVHAAASMVASSLLFRGIILRHSCVHSPKPLDGGVSNTSSASEISLARNGFDVALMVPNTVNNQKTAEAWVREHLATITHTNHE